VRRIALLVTLTIMGLDAAALQAAGCRLESQAHRVTLLELYTSEGCNSCPPVDRWFSSLPQRGIGADQVVQLAFHVDYWDQLGWRDRFSDHAFSVRQREVAARASNGVVYTPQVVLDGRDLHQNFSVSDLQRILNALNGEKGQATISTTVVNTGRALRVAGEIRADEADAGRRTEGWVAVFEQGLSSRVTRGENASKVLNHDFVVRALRGPFPLGADGRGSIDQVIELQPDWAQARLGLAVFVQRRDNGRTLQAVSSYTVCASER
jgi:hypothetical protein